MDVVTFGESMVLLTPEDGGLLETSTAFRKSVAGAESNFSIALSRLGHSVTWLSKLGDDGFGRFILKTLRGEGVDVSRVKIDETRPTAVFFKEWVPFGGTNVQYYRKFSAASSLSPEDVDATQIPGARIFHVTGITPALSEENCATVLHVMSKAKEQGIRISFDPNMRFKLWSRERAKDVFQQMASFASIALPGLDEGQFITGYETVEDVANWFLHNGSEIVVVKLGEKGAYYQTAKGQAGYVPGFVVPFVDEVGAGDAFAAGLISGLLDQVEIQEAVRRACALGAMAVCGRGDYEHAPDRATLNRFLSGQSSAITR